MFDMNKHGNKWTLKSTKHIPVDIIAAPSNSKILIQIPKPYPTDLTPFQRIHIRTIKSKINQFDPCYVEKHQVNDYGEVTQKEIEFRSQKFNNSKFTVELPFNFLSRQSSKLFFTLKMSEGRLLMQTIDGQFMADEWILDKNGVSLSFKQLLKFQEIMTDTRKRLKPTEQDIEKMFDEDGHMRDLQQQPYE